MSASCIFQIHPLTVDRGFQLECEGILPKPLQLQRLIEAVIAAAQIGQGLEAEIRIFDSTGDVAEVLELKNSNHHANVRATTYSRS